MKTTSVLIVDDSRNIAARLMEILKERVTDCTVNIATALSEAKHFLQHTVPQIILLDINLGDGNGLDFLRYLRQTYPSVKVIMLSHNTHAAYKQISRRLGASFFLDKAHDFDKLPDLITAL